VALAWLRDRPAVTAPIASATSMAQLEELTTGIRLQLDKAATDELDGASA
jgi:aryl-alcohol dehydrogenase-like predicted oxidoreductase